MSPRPTAGRWVTLARPMLEQLEERQLLSVTYHGGPLLQHVEVETVFLGQSWSTDPGLARQAGQINGFFRSITNSAYLDMLGEYGVGRGQLTNTIFDAGVMDSGTIANFTIETELQSLIAQGRLDAPDSNRLYFVFTAPDVLVDDGYGDSHTLGYHTRVALDFNSSALIPYAVVAYPGGANYAVPGLSAFEQLTSVSSHELAEAVTDPDVQTGWFAEYNANGGEIG